MIIDITIYKKWCYEKFSLQTAETLSIAKGLIEKMGGTIQADLNANIFAIEIRFLIQD